MKKIKQEFWLAGKKRVVWIEIPEKKDLKAAHKRLFG